VKKEDLPKSYEICSIPSGKESLASSRGLRLVLGRDREMGEARASSCSGTIVSANGISVRKGHTLLTICRVIWAKCRSRSRSNNYKAEQLKNKGARSTGSPSRRHCPAQRHGHAAPRPHPHAAVLFFDFMLSGCADLLLKRDFVPTSKKVKTR